MTAIGFAEGKKIKDVLETLPIASGKCSTTIWANRWI